MAVYFDFHRGFAPASFSHLSDTHSEAKPLRSGIIVLCLSELASCIRGFAVCLLTRRIGRADFYLLTIETSDPGGAAPIVPVIFDDAGP